MQASKTQEHQKCHHLTPWSYPITITHIESPLHIWDDFVGAYIPNLLALMGVFAPTPFEKSQLIQFLLIKENFNSISSQILASIC